MIKDVDVDRYINAVSISCDHIARHQTYMRLICSCLPALSILLPDIALNACRVAEEYWISGVGGGQKLDATREQCWNYLDRNHSSTSLTSPTVVAIRAVICALYPEAESEDFDDETLRWFVMLLNKLGDYSKIVDPLLAEYSNGAA